MTETGRLVAWITIATALALAGGAGALTYSEVTDETGVDFRTAGEVHPDGDDDWPAFPEIMGSGACIADFDGDGYDDVYLVNQRYNEHNPATEGWIEDVDPRNQLYVNQGDGTFEERGAQAGVDSDAFGYGCSAADYDGDGDVDLFVSNFGENALFENQGNATFANVTSAAGVPGDACGEHRCMSTSSAWADYDGDGDVDLYVGNYVDTSLTDENRGPTGHVGQHNLLYRNEGDGTFTEVASDEGVAGQATDEDGSKTLGVVWLDVDQDGDQDLYVANDVVENDYYENLGGTFQERSHEANLADRRASMGVTAQDYDADGYPDLFFTHYDLETNGFYWNEGDGTYEDRSGEDDHLASLPMVGWGTSFVDADRDGDLDIVLANGHTEWDEDDYDQPFQAFRQDPEPSTAGKDKQWTDVSQAWGLDATEDKVTRGLAIGDLDLDGDTDVVGVPNANQTAQVLEASGVTNHHLTIELTQPGPNPDAIGARIAVTVDGTSQYRALRTGTSYLSQNSLKAGFGLGSASQAGDVTVRWPDGATTQLVDVPADQVIRVNRSTGDYINDTIAPATSSTLEGTKGDNGWWVSPVDIEISAEDRGVTFVSGLNETQMAVGNETWSPAEPITLEEGVHPVHHRAIDKAGNVGPRVTDLVRVDLEAPEVEHVVDGRSGENGWWISEDVTVRIRASDAISGVDRLQVRVDDGPWTITDGNVTFTGEGLHTVAYRALDRAGHVSEETSVTVKLDYTAPNVTAMDPAPGVVYVGTQSLTPRSIGPSTIFVPPPSVTPASQVFLVRADVSDAESGVANVTSLVDGDPLVEETGDHSYAWSWNVSREPSGLHEVRIEASDVAGNHESRTVTVVLASLTENSLKATVEDGPGAYTSHTSNPIWLGPTDPFGVDVAPEARAPV